MRKTRVWVPSFIRGRTICIDDPRILKNTFIVYISINIWKDWPKNLGAPPTPSKYPMIFFEEELSNQLNDYWEKFFFPSFHSLMSNLLLYLLKFWEFLDFEDFIAFLFTLVIYDENEILKNFTLEMHDYNCHWA